jgi:restriction system protein
MTMQVSKRKATRLRALFEILAAAPEGLKAAEALARLERQSELTPYENENFPSGPRRFEVEMRFNSIAFVKAGWLLKERGVWRVTEAGKAALAKYPQPEPFRKEALQLYYKSRENGQESTPEVLTEADEGEEQSTAQITLERAEETAWDEIEIFLKTMQPYDFQALSSHLLKAMGYHIAWISPPGKDGGLDIIAFTDPLGVTTPRLKVQVKRLEARVTLDTLKSFTANINADEVGIFIALGGFTKDAENFARAHAKVKITLVDMERLVDLWTEYYNRLDDTARRLMPLKPVYFLAKTAI